MRSALHLVALSLALAAGGCSEDPAGNGRHGGGPPGAGGGGAQQAAAVPVEVASAERRDIAGFIETHGTLEAENEVDIVARAAGPIVKLEVEEGDAVTAGQLLARIDEADYRAQYEISRVALSEAEVAYERAKALTGEKLISSEDYEQARTSWETARAQLQASELQLEHTRVRAPFGGLIVNRYVDFAEQVTVNAPLFRLSDFTPLLCPIQVPERELSKLDVGQAAYLTVEAFGERRFPARIERIRPVVEAATGTIRVTLEVDGAGRLRPGMFAGVFVETERRPGSLVIPKAALALESLGDTVYVADGGVAARRDVELGLSEGDWVEVLSGVSHGESIVVVGQDGLSDGTPVQVLEDSEPAVAGAPDSATPSAEQPQGEQRPPGGFDIEQIKQRMRDRGMTEEQIEQRLEQFRQRRQGQRSGDQ